MSNKPHFTGSQVAAAIRAKENGIRWEFRPSRLPIDSRVIDPSLASIATATEDTESGFMSFMRHAVLMFGVAK